MSRLTSSVVVFGTAMCLIASASGAAAQVYVPPPINYGTGIQSIRNSQMLTLRQMVERNAIRKRQYGARGKSSPAGPSPGANKGRGPAGGNSAPAPPARGTTTFRPVAPMIVPQQLASKSQAERGEAERFFAKLLGEYREIMRSKGLPPNDVARAASFLVAISHDVYSDAGKLGPGQLDGLREQMREVFAEDAQFQRLSDREKQELFEGYAIIGMYLSGVPASKGDDREWLAQMRRLARTQLEETFGVSVDRLVFTNDGVKYR